MNHSKCRLSRPVRLPRLAGISQSWFPIIDRFLRLEHVPRLSGSLLILFSLTFNSSSLHRLDHVYVFTSRMFDELFTNPAPFGLLNLSF